MENLYHKYKLTKITDINSRYKSENAKKITFDLCLENGINYVSLDNDDFINTLNCENDVINNQLEQKNSICNMHIVEIYTLEEYDKNNVLLREINIGNNCISHFLQQKIITNLTEELYTNIVYNLRIKNTCIFCTKRLTKNASYHKRCFQKNNRNLNTYTIKIMKLKSKCLLQIKLKKYLPIVKGLFINNTNLKRNLKNKDKDPLSTLEYLKKMIKKYKYFYRNKDIILSFKNNPLINSIQNHTKSPTEKQLELLKKIINNHKKLLMIDNNIKIIERKKKKNKLNSYQLKIYENYIKYGFVYI